jgi:hypothetical protein
VSETAGPPLDPRISFAAGPPFLLWFSLFVTGAIAPVLRLYVDLALAEGIRVPGAHTWIGRDFTNLWVGSKLAIEGVNIYDNSAYLAGLAKFGITQGQNYSYPPATLLIGTPLSLIPYPAALVLWFIAGWVAFVFAARRYIRFNPLWLLLLPSTVVTRNGQWGVFAAAFFLWSFRGSGLAAGLLTLKPHLGILLAATMAFKRRWQQIAVALLTCALLWGVAELAFGLTRQFLTDGVAVQRAILTDPRHQPYFGGMPSAFIRMRGSAFAWPAQIVTTSLALAMLWRVRKRPMMELAFPVATATFIVLPYSFGYDMAVVSLGFAVMIHERWQGLATWEKWIACLAFLSPAFTAYMIAPLILLAGLFLQTRQPIAPPSQVAPAL